MEIKKSIYQPLTQKSKEVNQLFVLEEVKEDDSIDQPLIQKSKTVGKIDSPELRQNDSIHQSLIQKSKEVRNSASRELRKDKERSDLRAKCLTREAFLLLWNWQHIEPDHFSSDGKTLTAESGVVRFFYFIEDINLTTQKGTVLDHRSLDIDFTDKRIHDDLQKYNISIKIKKTPYVCCCWTGISTSYVLTIGE